MSRFGAQMRGALAKLGLVLVGLVAVLMPAEALLRLRGYDPTQFQWEAVVNPDMLELTGNPDLPYVLKPRTEGRIWDTRVRVDGYGFREREFPEDKGDRVRIAAVGDSITFGMEIDEPSLLYPAQLETRLAAEAADRPVGVLNFGVAGYDVLNDVEHLRLRGLRFRPDVVVWQLCVNDIGTASTAAQWVKAATRLHNPVFRLRLARFILSRALRIVSVRQAVRDGQVGPFVADHRGRILPVDDDPVLRQLMARLPARETRLEFGFRQWWADAPRLGFLEYAFTRLKQLQQEHGFQVVLVSVPLLTPDDTGGGRIVNDIVRHEAEKFGFRFVDVFDRFEARGLVQLRNNADENVHPSPEGHAIIARALADELAASPLLRRQ